MNDIKITRQQAIKTGAEYMSLLMLALLAATVPQPQPALPDWLADAPEWVQPYLARIVKATVDLDERQPYGEEFLGYAAKLIEYAARD